MALPTIHGTGRLTRDPELRYTTQGVAVCTVDIAFNSRRRNQAGEWEDGETCFLRGTVWREQAEHVAESLIKGVEVIVTGTLRQRSFETRDGQQRTMHELDIATIAPSLRAQTAKVTKATSGTGSVAAAPEPADPWQSGYGDTPPF